MFHPLYRKPPQRYTVCGYAGEDLAYTVSEKFLIKSRWYFPDCYDILSFLVLPFISFMATMPHY
jgi:hypothetical protein